jgi:FAD/FMN-containing dehydrogenase
MKQARSPSGGAGPLKMPAGVAFDSDPESLDPYRRDADVVGQHGPRAILTPHNTREIQTIVTWAAQEGIGVIPASSAAPRRRGDTVPAHDRCVVLDLSRMAGVLHVDARDKIIVVEPGVRFGEIDNHLFSYGLRAFRPLAPRAGKSLIASYLEREPLISPNHHWDTADPFGGTGVVLGTGEYVTTGGAATPGTLQEKLARGDRQMLPTGPANIDLLRVLQGAQGSLGVMSWAAIYCERLPKVEQAWFASADTLDPLVNLAREVTFRRLGNALFIVNRVQLALMIANGEAELNALVHTLPHWILFTRLAAGQHHAEQQYGADEKLAWQQHDLDQCAGIFGTRLERHLNGYEANSFANQLHRSDLASFRDRIWGDHRSMFFLQQLNKAAGFVKIVEIARNRLHGGDMKDLPLGVYLQPTVQGVSAHIEFTIPFDPSKAGLSKKLDETLLDAAQACSDAGAFFSRPYHAWSSIAFSKDRAIAPILAMTKSVLDPAGIMNPGRIPYRS